jgi:PGF-pre-PGF domain-containing protein
MMNGKKKLILSLFIILAVALSAILVYAALTSVTPVAPTPGNATSWRGDITFNITTDGTAVTNVNFSFILADGGVGQGTAPFNKTISNTSVNQTNFNFTIDSSLNLTEDRAYNVTVNITNSTGSSIFRTIIGDGDGGFFVYNDNPLVFNFSLDGNEANNRNFSSGSIVVNVTVNDTLSSTDPGAGLSLVRFRVTNGSVPLYYVASTTHTTTAFGVHKNQSFWNDTINLSTLAEGLHNITIIANDSIDCQDVTSTNTCDPNQNDTVFLTFRVDTLVPAVTIVTPSNGSNFSLISSNQVFNATILEINTMGTVFFMFDNASGTDFNLTATNQSGHWNATYNVSTLAEGSHTVTVFANDTVGNINNTESINLIVDFTAPVATILNASFNTTDSTPDVRFNLTDNLHAVANCTLLLNGTGYGTNLSVGNNTNVTITVNSALTTGHYNATVNCTDPSANTAASTNSINIIATITVPTTTTTTTSSSSSSRGGSGGAATTQGVGFQQETWPYINKGEKSAMSLNKAGIPIKAISFELGSKTYGAWVRVQVMDSYPSTVSQLGKEMFSRLDITKSPTMDNDDILNAEIDFSVDLSWLRQNSLYSSQVSLYRYADGKWSELVTKFVREDDNKAYYSAESPGFSYFAIAQGTQGAPTAEEIAADSEVTGDTPEDAAPVTGATKGATTGAATGATDMVSKTGSLIIVIAVLVALIAIIFYNRLGKNKK